MSAPNAFDELARRKLAEREHPFDEAAWEALRPALDAQHGRRRRRFIIWLSLLLGVGGTTWWMAHQRTSTEGSAQIPTPLVQEQPSPKATTTERSDTSSQKQPIAPPTTQAMAHAEQNAPAPLTAIGKNANASGGSATSPSKKVAQRGTITPMPTSVEPAHATDQPAVGTVANQSSTTAAGHIPQDPITDSKLHTTAIPGEQDDAPAPPANVAATSGSDTVASASETHTDSTVYVSAMDTLSAPDTSITECSLPPARRLELSAWGGPFMTHTRYSGERTADWAGTMSAQRSFAYGVELMRQGAHFGFGAGLHYTTYAEQMEAPALQDEHRTWVTDYHLNAVDTTLLVVNGTIMINGQQYYSTHLLDTTLYVLVGSTREVAYTSVRRNALTRSNRTSYLEIPLLFEAHTRRGAWTFALRGGPMVGILQGRRGALPTTTGYTDLNDEAFSAMVLGYTLQGHVRYHFSELWSVGVGPSVRGQLMNGVQSSGLQRRSNATGAVISVGYRLP